MSLAEVLDGLHWEKYGSSTTTGMGPMWVSEIGERPPWAVLYLIRLDTEPSWEIGLAQDFSGGMASMPRAPILSSAGLGVLVDFPAGPKSIGFADAVPEALKRYIKRLEREAEVPSGNREMARERLTSAGRARKEG